MASAKDDQDQWQSPDLHAWKNDEDNDDEDDGNEFFDANENPTETNLLHERLNEKLNIETPKIEDPYFIDEDLLKERELLLTDEEKEKRHVESQKSKDEGNELFGQGEFDQALAKYSDALSFCPLKQTRDRAVIYANRAACLMKMEKFEPAIQCCTKSIELDGTYLKPYIRRAESYKKIDKLDEALLDYQKILELDPNNSQARHEVHVLPDQIKERNEKMKEEMLGKLKDLGNMILKPFGLSTNNFKLQQDPSTGSYSVNFQK